MKEKNYKKCVICGKEYPCTPSRNVVTCSRECRLKYLSQNHKGLKMSAATREKMAESRKKVPNSAEIQRMATEAAKKSPKSGRFIYCYDFRNIAFLVYICYNASRQWNKYLHIQRKPQRVAFSGVFYSVKWFNLLGWLPYSSPSSHLQI